jgi:hypothetical protein
VSALSRIRPRGESSSARASLGPLDRLTGLRLVVLALSLALSSAPTAARADSFSYPTLAEVMTRAAVVARVRVLAVEQIEFEFAGARRTCGLSVRATIEDGIKGPKGEIQFHVAERDLRPDVSEYFLVAEANTVQAARERARLVGSAESELDRAYSECVATVPLSTASVVQQFIPIVQLPGSGEKWLAPDRKSVAHLSGVIPRERRSPDNVVRHFLWYSVRAAVASELSSLEQERTRAPAS